MDYKNLSDYLKNSYQLNCHLQQREVAPLSSQIDNLEPGEVLPQPQMQEYLSCSAQEEAGLGDIYVHIARPGEYQIGQYYDIVCHETDSYDSCYIGGRAASTFYGDIQFSLNSRNNSTSVHFISPWNTIDERVRGIYNYLNQHVSFSPIIPSSW